MLTTEQEHYLFQLGKLFSQLENLFSLQQLEHIRYTFFNMHQHVELSDDDQHVRSLEREKRFRAEKLKQGF